MEKPVYPEDLKKSVATLFPYNHVFDSTFKARQKRNMTYSVETGKVSVAP